MNYLFQYQSLTLFEQYKTFQPQNKLLIGIKFQFNSNSLKTYKDFSFPLSLSDEMKSQNSQGDHYEFLLIHIFIM
ncbi:hypothetical protein pb186bvf_001808 [Paramecium bursaria]